MHMLKLINESSHPYKISSDSLVPSRPRRADWVDSPRTASVNSLPSVSTLLRSGNEAEFRHPITKNTDGNQLDGILK